MSFEHERPSLDSSTPCGFECRPLNTDYCIAAEHADQILRVSVTEVQVAKISRLLCETILQVTAESQVNNDLDTYAIDELTGLITRSAAKPQLCRRIQLLLSEPKENLECNVNGVYLAFIDLDGFKAVNDLHPRKHAAGDEVLRLVASKLQSITRKEDFLCRWGGDEILLIGSLAPRDEVNEKYRASMDGPAEFGQRVLEAVTFNFDGFPISASIGVVNLSRDNCTISTDEDVDAEILNADSAMYTSKREGKGRVTVHCG